MQIKVHHRRFFGSRGTHLSLIQHWVVALIIISLFGEPASAQWWSDGPNRAASSLPPRITFSALCEMLAAENINLDCQAAVSVHQAYAQQFNQIVEECASDAALVATTLASSLPLNLTDQEYANQRARWLRRVDAAARLEDQLLNQLRGASGMTDEGLTKLEGVRRRRHLDRQIEVIQRRYLLTGEQVPPSSTAGFWSDGVLAAMDAEERRCLIVALDRHLAARLHAWLQASVAVEQAVKATVDLQRGTGIERAGQQLPSVSLGENVRKAIVVTELAAIKDMLASVKPQTALLLRRRSWLNMQDVQPSAELESVLPRLSFDSHPTIRSFATVLLGVSNIDLDTKQLALPVLAEWIRNDAEIVDERLRTNNEVNEHDEHNAEESSRAELAKAKLTRLRELTGLEWLKEGANCPHRREDLIPLTTEFAQALGSEEGTSRVPNDSKLSRLGFSRFIDSEGMLPTPVSRRELGEVLDWIALNAEQLVVAKQVLADADGEWSAEIEPRISLLRSVYSQGGSATESLVRERVEKQSLRRELWSLVAAHQQGIVTALRQALGPTAAEGLALLDASLLAHTRDAYTYGCLAIRSEFVSSELPNVIRWSYQVRALPAERMLLTRAIAGHLEDLAARERANWIAALALQEAEEKMQASHLERHAIPDASDNHQASKQDVERVKQRRQILDEIRSVNRDVFVKCSENLPTQLLTRWQAAAQVYGCSPRLVALCEAQHDALEMISRNAADASGHAFEVYERSLAPCEAWALEVVKTVDRVQGGRADPALRVALKEVLLLAPLKDAQSQADFALECINPGGDSKSDLPREF